MMYNFAGICVHLSPDLLQISKPKQTENVTSLTSNAMISQKTSVLEMKKKFLTLFLHGLLMIVLHVCTQIFN